MSSENGVDSVHSGEVMIVRDMAYAHAHRLGRAALEVIHHAEDGEAHGGRW